MMASMAEVTLTLPAAPPEVYLLGDPVADLIDIEVPKRIEAMARRAVRNGVPEIAPTLRLEESLAREATSRSRSRWELLRSMGKTGAPRPDPRVVELQARAARAADEVLGPPAGS